MATYLRDEDRTLAFAPIFAGTNDGRHHRLIALSHEGALLLDGANYYVFHQGIVDLTLAGSGTLDGLSYIGGFRVSDTMAIVYTSDGIAKSVRVNTTTGVASVASSVTRTVTNGAYHWVMASDDALVGFRRTGIAVWEWMSWRVAPNGTFTQLASGSHTLAPNLYYPNNYPGDGFSPQTEPERVGSDIYFHGVVPGARDGWRGTYYHQGRMLVFGFDNSTGAVSLKHPSVPDVHSHWVYVWGNSYSGGIQHVTPASYLHNGVPRTHVVHYSADNLTGSVRTPANAPYYNSADGTWNSPGVGTNIERPNGTQHWGDKYAHASFGVKENVHYIATLDDSYGGADAILVYDPAVSVSRASQEFILTGGQAGSYNDISGVESGWVWATWGNHALGTQHVGLIRDINATYPEDVGDSCVVIESALLGPASHASMVTVDGRDYVAVTAPSGSEGWRAHLLRRKTTGGLEVITSQNLSGMEGIPAPSKDCQNWLTPLPDTVTYDRELRIHDEDWKVTPRPGYYLNGGKTFTIHGKPADQQQRINLTWRHISDPWNLTGSSGYGTGSANSYSDTFTIPDNPDYFLWDMSVRRWPEAASTATRYHQRWYQVETKGTGYLIVTGGKVILFRLEGETFKVENIKTYPAATAHSTAVIQAVDTENAVVVTPWEGFSVKRVEDGLQTAKVATHNTLSSGYPLVTNSVIRLGPQEKNVYAPVTRRYLSGYSAIYMEHYELRDAGWVLVSHIHVQGSESSTTGLAWHDSGVAKLNDTDFIYMRGWESLPGDYYSYGLTRYRLNPDDTSVKVWGTGWNGAGVYVGYLPTTWKPRMSHGGLNKGVIITTYQNDREIRILKTVVTETGYDIVCDLPLKGLAGNPLFLDTDVVYGEAVGRKLPAALVSQGYATAMLLSTGAMIPPLRTVARDDDNTFGTPRIPLHGQTQSSSQQRSQRIYLGGGTYI